MKKKCLIVLVVMLLLCSCGKNNSMDDTTNNRGTSKVGIKYVSVYGDYVLMVTNNDEMYAYGKLGYMGTINMTDGPKVIATNVKKVINNDTSVYYIDNNSNLYYIGNGVMGGGTKEFELVTSGVNDGAIYLNFCALYMKNDGVYIQGSNGRYCGFKEDKGDLRKIGLVNVKKVYTGYLFSAYMDNNNDLYMAVSTQYSNGYDEENNNYKKLLSNVKDITEHYLLTNDNKVYYLYPGDLANTKLLTLKEVSINGQSIYNDAYIESNKIHYCERCGGTKYYEYTFDYNDVKELYYRSGKKVVYLNNNNKIVLASDTTNDTLDVSTKNMKKIYEFLQA